MQTTLSVLLFLDRIVFGARDAFLEAGVYLVYFAPIILLGLLWQVYLRYLRANYIKDTEWVMLEIKIPKEITKSPKAMELLLEVFYQTYEGELIDRFIRGSTRNWFSLELVSVGGQIHFYFMIPKFFQNMVETRIYSQYPEVEIATVDDYARMVNFGQPGSPWKNIRVWNYEWDKKDKDDAYPIKTYVDYEMDKDPDEEFKIDPMTPMLEFLSSIKPYEQVWIQIMIMAAKDRFIDVKGKKVDWRKAKGQILVDKLMKRDIKTADVGVAWTKTMLTEEERDTIKAVERNLNKFPFDVGIRTAYISTEELKPATWVALNSAFKQFSAPGFNGFKPMHQTGFDNPWQDPFGWRTRKRRIQHFKYYVNRSYFYPPASTGAKLTSGLCKPLGMSTEEIATIYHFPGQVATTPTLARIPSKRGEPPENLPI